MSVFQFTAVFLVFLVNVLDILMLSQKHILTA